MVVGGGDRGSVMARLQSGARKPENEYLPSLPVIISKAREQGQF